MSNTTPPMKNHHIDGVFFPGNTEGDLQPSETDGPLTGVSTVLKADRGEDNLSGSLPGTGTTETPNGAGT